MCALADHAGVEGSVGAQELKKRKGNRRDGAATGLSENRIQTEPYPLTRPQRQHLVAPPITKDMNAALVKKALDKVLDPKSLVNLVSQRVRQLNFDGGGRGRPLVADTANLGAADIALREIIEDKMGWEMPEMQELTGPTRKNRRRR